MYINSFWPQQKPRGRYPNFAHEETKAQKVQWLAQGSPASRWQMQSSNPGRLARVCMHWAAWSAVQLLDLNLCIYSSWYRTRKNRVEFLIVTLWVVDSVSDVEILRVTNVDQVNRGITFKMSPWKKVTFCFFSDSFFVRYSALKPPLFGVTRSAYTGEVYNYWYKKSVFKLCPGTSWLDSVTGQGRRPASVSFPGPSFTWVLFTRYRTPERCGLGQHPDPLGSLCLQTVWFPLCGGGSHVYFENIY